MLHPATELVFINPVIGLGVRTTRDLPAGTLTWVQDRLDRVLPPSAVASLPAPTQAGVDKYAYVDAAGHFVLCWDTGRYMNHACDAPVRSVGRAEVLVRDVSAGTHLTCDYATLNLTPAQQFACGCGVPSCRGTVRPSDLDQFGAGWDAEMRAAAPRIARVPQPLWDLLAETPDNQHVQRLLAVGRYADLPGCLAGRHRPSGAA